MPEDTGVRLGDGTVKLFFYANGDKKGLTPELRAFLEYVNMGIATDEYTRELERRVWRARTNLEWRREYMKTVVHDMDVWREGREEGRMIGRIEQVIKKLRKDKSVRQIADELEADEASIQKICTVAKEFAPQYDAEQILAAIKDA